MARKIRGLDVSEISLGDAAEMVAPSRVGPEPRIPTGEARETSFRAANRLMGVQPPQLPASPIPVGETPPPTDISAQANKFAEQSKARVAGLRAGTSPAPAVTPKPAAPRSWNQVVASGARSAFGATSNAAKSALSLATGQTARTLGAGAAGAGLAGYVNERRQAELDAQPAFTPQPTQPGQIPGAAPGMVAPRAQAGSFLNQSELGRNVGNIVNALPGGLAMTAPVRVAAPVLSSADIVRRSVDGAQRGAAVLSPTARVVEAAARGFAAGDAVMPGTSSLPERVAPAAPASGNQTAAYEKRLGMTMNSTAGDGRGGNGLGAPGVETNVGPRLAGMPRDLSFLPAGDVFKTTDANGRTVYSGRDVREGANVVDRYGRKTGELSGGSVPGMDLASTERARTIEGRNSQLRGEIDAYGPGLSGGGMTGIRAPAKPAEAPSVNDLMRQGLSARQAAQQISQFQERQQNSADINARLQADAANEAARNATSITTTQMNNDTALRTARAQGVSTSMRLQFERDEAARKQGLVRQAVAASKGDYGAAARMLAGAGHADLAKDLQGLGANEQTAAGARDKMSDERYAATAERLKPYFQTGGVNDKGEAVVDGPGIQAAIKSLQGQYGAQFFELPKPQQQQAILEAARDARLMQGGLDRQARGITDFFESDAAFLPSEKRPDLKGAQVRVAGPVESAFDSRYRSGDVVVRLANGEVRVINKNAIQSRQDIEDLKNQTR